jgi:hypothetical protein
MENDLTLHFVKTYFIEHPEQFAAFWRHPGLIPPCPNPDHQGLDFCATNGFIYLDRKLSGKQLYVYYLQSIRDKITPPPLARTTIANQTDENRELSRHRPIRF